MHYGKCGSGVFLPFSKRFFFGSSSFHISSKADLKFQLDLEQRTNTSHVFTLLVVSSVKGSITVTCKTDAFYIVMLDGLCASRRLAYFSHVHQSLINNRYTFRHECGSRNH